MTPRLRRILFRFVIAALLAAPVIAFLDYFLPHHAVLRVVGTQVKRISDKSLATGFYVFAEEIDTKKPRVFRDEDTGWGFPWYFKFNAADVQAVAQSIADERGTAIFTYYGWRIQILSMFPNVIKIVRAEPDAWPLPWFNLALFGAILGAGVWFTVRRIRKQQRLMRTAGRTKTD